MFLWYREGRGFPWGEVDLLKDAEFVEALELFLEFVTAKARE